MTSKTPEGRSATFWGSGFRLFSFFVFLLLFLYSGDQNLFGVPQLLHDFLVTFLVVFFFEPSGGEGGRGGGDSPWRPLVFLSDFDLFLIF